MNLSTSMQQTKDLFTFPFSDPKWKSKLGIGTLLMFANFVIPIIPAIPLAGYSARLIRAGASNSDPSKLPEWDDWGDLFLDGLRLLVSGLIFQLPGIVLMVVGWVIYMMGFISMTTAQNSGSQSGPPLFFFMAMMIFFLSLGAGMLLLLAATLIMPPVVAHVAVKRHFSALFEVGRWWSILKANFLGFLLALGIFMLVYLVTMTVWQVLYFTIILCLVAPLLISPLMVYATVLLFRLIGQAYGEGQEKVMIKPAPVEPEIVEPPAVEGPSIEGPGAEQPA